VCEPDDDGKSKVVVVFEPMLHDGEFKRLPESEMLELMRHLVKVRKAVEGRTLLASGGYWCHPAIDSPTVGTC
jgi:hypothetical protein